MYIRALYISMRKEGNRYFTAPIVVAASVCPRYILCEQANVSIHCYEHTLTYGIIYSHGFELVPMELVRAMSLELVGGNCIWERELVHF